MSFKKFFSKNFAFLMLTMCIICGGLECICPPDEEIIPPVEEPPVIVMPANYTDYPDDW